MIEVTQKDGTKRKIWSLRDLPQIGRMLREEKRLRQERIDQAKGVLNQNPQSETNT